MCVIESAKHWRDKMKKKAKDKIKRHEEKLSKGERIWRFVPIDTSDKREIVLIKFDAKDIEIKEG